MIEMALEFLEQNEPTWNLDEPIDREEYIRDLVAHAS